MHVAQDLCITQAAYSLIENSQNGVVAEHVIQLSDLYGVTTDYILKGNNMLLEISPKNEFIPYINVDAQAGFVQNFGKEVSYEEQDWFRLPGFRPTHDEKLFEVEGKSMVPTIFPQDVVVCQVQEKWDRLLSGSVVVVVTKDRIVIERLEKIEEGHMVLVADNPESDPRTSKFKLEDIRQVMTVAGKLTSVIIPHHQIVSQGKMKVMEESIEFLKKELLMMNKKLSEIAR